MEHKPGLLTEAHSEGPNYAARLVPADILDHGLVAVGRDAALSTCFRRDYRRLVHLARLLVDLDGEAEEIVQEAFARVYASWPRVRDKADPGGYLRSTVVNLARSRLRRKITERRLRGRTEIALEPNRSSGESAEEVVVRRDSDRSVADLVRKLPRRQREAIILRYFEMLNTAETAKTMGCSPGAVKHYLNRAMKTMRTQLEES